MAKAGDTIYSPNFDETIRFVRTSAETNGELLETEATYGPNQTWDEGVEHFHPHQDESFEVLEGMISVRMNGNEKRYVAGERFEVPRGTVHLMRNLSSKPTRLRWQIRPALQAERFFETVWGLSQDGKLPDGGISYLLQFAVILQAYGDVFRVAAPPPLVQRLVFPLLALIGRMLGYPAIYKPVGEGTAVASQTA